MQPIVQDQPGKSGHHEDLCLRTTKQRGGVGEANAVTASAKNLEVRRKGCADRQHLAGHTLRLSTASLDLTPTYPMPLAGYAHRSGPYDKVDHALEAIFLLLSDDQGRSVVLGSVDTLFLTVRTLSDIANVMDRAPVPLYLFATHTHNAPSLAPELPLLGQHDSEWYRHFVSTCARSISALVEHPSAPVALRYGERVTDLNVNRRRLCWVADYRKLLKDHRIRINRRIALAAYKSGVIDRRVRALFFEDGYGDVKAIVWSLAAHPAFYPAFYSVSPDFPGLIRDLLRKRFGAECAIVYLPGFAGSAIPNIPPRLPRTLRGAIASVLPFNPTLRSFGAKSYKDWVNRVFVALMCAYDNRDHPLSETRVSVKSTKVSGIFRYRNGSAENPGIDLHVSRVSLGPGLDILACNGEMLCEWTPLLHYVGAGRMFHSGYLAGDALYVPTSSEIPEGGYEVTGFQESFGLDGEFHPEISRLVVAATGRLFGGDADE
jgi:hypothetical protein